VYPAFELDGLSVDRGDPSNGREGDGGADH
jgi:hypothetical protein